MRDHLSAAGKFKDSEEPVPPDAVMHLWEWFVELSRARTSAGFGANPISYSEIDAWARLTARRPHPWEIRAIRELDTLYLIANAQQD